MDRPPGFLCRPRRLHVSCYKGYYQQFCETEIFEKDQLCIPQTHANLATVRKHEQRLSCLCHKKFCDQHHCRPQHRPSLDSCNRHANNRRAQSAKRNLSFSYGPLACWRWRRSQRVVDDVLKIASSWSALSPFPPLLVSVQNRPCSSSHSPVLRLLKRVSQRSQSVSHKKGCCSCDMQHDLGHGKSFRDSFRLLPSRLGYPRPFGPLVLTPCTPKGWSCTHAGG